MSEKITVEKNKLLKFLEMVALRGEIANSEVVLDVQKNQMSGILISASKVIAIRGTLKGNFSDWGKLGIDNLETLRKFLASFGSADIIIDYKTNKIVLSSKDDNLQASAVLRNIDYIQNILPDEKFENAVKTAAGNNFILTKIDTKKIVDYFASILPANLQLDGIGNSITVRLENNQNEILASFPMSQKHTPFSVKLSRVFVDLLSVITDDIEVSIKEKQPVYLKIENNDYRIEYLVAPVK